MLYNTIQEILTHEKSSTCIDDLYAANINLTKAITNLHINKALYEKR